MNFELEEDGLEHEGLGKVFSVNGFADEVGKVLRCTKTSAKELENTGLMREETCCGPIGW